MWLKAEKQFPSLLQQRQLAFLQMSHNGQVFCPKFIAAWTCMGEHLQHTACSLREQASASLERTEWV